MSETRRVLLVAHTGRGLAREIAAKSARDLVAQGLVVRLLVNEAQELGITEDESPLFEVVEPIRVDDDCEIALVIGGDGSILRAAELTHRSGTPLLGVNLGHVGFLAEAEPEEIDRALTAIVERNYRVEERLALDVSVSLDGQLLFQTFALNEASVEKSSRERMIEVIVEIDGRPVSRWGCDGVVCATPTGSTAYNFSAGGPIVWPDVEALLMVPISAHALFARALVASPNSVLAIEMVPDTAANVGVLWCDGRRPFDLPAGARIEVRRSAEPVRLVRIHGDPFTDRLVHKFALPVTGWRGAS